ncbi:polyketide synthase [Lysobacter enzymogenes]|nr:polyketide synthase [Lysobacter enzymogenes]
MCCRTTTPRSCRPRCAPRCRSRSRRRQRRRSPPPIPTAGRRRRPTTPRPTAMRARNPRRSAGAAAAPGPIAIVGMSGRFPQSPDLQTLWAHLAAGDEVTEPITRWRIDSLGLPDDIKVCPRGGFLGDIDQFDPLFFNISGTEANFMDPQHRVLLETSWHALEDAGYAGQGIAGARCGVYMGFNGGDYGELLHGQPSLPPHAMWGNAASVLSARIAYYLDLQGPAITLDTACSSSLVAVHLACQGLWTGETDVALAGGVWIQCTPGFLISSSRAGMLSPTGRCRAFGDQADGFVPSEGVGVVVLKRLQDALDAGDHIYGVIRGSAINQDGASNGITAPSAGAQERLQRHVYDSFGIDAGRLQMVEAHGTGTILGDPIEAAALSRSLSHYSDRTGFCAIGSIKTNIGHTGAAAGVAGLIKVLLSLQHRQIPPSLHFDRPNPHIAFADSPLTVNTQLKHWEAPAAGRRLAAVSSFGLSGTNAHVVVEEAPPAAAAASAAQPTLLVLSGFREEDLPAQVAALAEHLERESALELSAAGYTLAVGRRHHRHRLALVAHDAADAAAELRRWLAGGSSRVLAGTATAGNGGDERFAPARQRLHALVQARDDGERAAAGGTGRAARARPRARVGFRVRLAAARRAAAVPFLAQAPLGARARAAARRGRRGAGCGRRRARGCRARCCRARYCRASGERGARDRCAAERGFAGQSRPPLTSPASSPRPRRCIRSCTPRSPAPTARVTPRAGAARSRSCATMSSRARRCCLARPAWKWRAPRRNWRVRASARGNCAMWCGCGRWPWPSRWTCRSRWSRCRRATTNSRSASSARAATRRIARAGWSWTRRPGAVRSSMSAPCACAATCARSRAATTTAYST